MLTEYDKAISAVLVPLAIWLNQKYGMALPVDPETMGYFIAGITAAVVYLIPNKKAA